jgi:hypothetical protein
MFGKINTTPNQQGHCQALAKTIGTERNIPASHYFKI